VAEVGGLIIRKLRLTLDNKMKYIKPSKFRAFSISLILSLISLVIYAGIITKSLFAIIIASAIICIVSIIESRKLKNGIKIEKEYIDILGNKVYYDKIEKIVINKNGNEIDSLKFILNGKPVGVSLLYDNDKIYNEIKDKLANVNKEYNNVNKDKRLILFPTVTLISIALFEIGRNIFSIHLTLEWFTIAYFTVMAFGAFIYFAIKSRKENV
jgi:hypothetical protein